MADTTPNTPEQLDVASATTDELAAILDAAALPQPVKQEEPAAEPEQSADEKTAETTEPAEEPAVDPEATEPEQPKEKGKRWRMPEVDEKTEAVLALVKSGKSAKDAYEAVYGAQEKAKEEPVQHPDPIAAIDASIAADKKALDELKAKRKAALDEANLNEYDALGDQLYELKDKIKSSEASKSQAIEQAKQAKADSIAVADTRRVVDMFPELGDKQSSEHAAFQEFIQKAAANPEYEALFASGEWRLRLAKDFALETGLTPVGRRKASEPPATQKAAPVQSPAPVKQAPKPQASAAKNITTKDAPTGSASTQTLTAADIAKMSHSELTALLNAQKR